MYICIYIYIYIHIYIYEFDNYIQISPKYCVFKYFVLLFINLFLTITKDQCVQHRASFCDVSYQLYIETTFTLFCFIYLHVFKYILMLMNTYFCS